jgi:hypothetical protein
MASLDYDSPHNMSPLGGNPGEPSLSLPVSALGWESHESSLAVAIWVPSVLPLSLVFPSAQVEPVAPVPGNLS